MEVRRRVRTRALLTLLAALSAAAVGITAAAEKEAQQKFEIKKADDGKKLLVSFDYSAIFDGNAVKKLASGLPTVVLMRLYLHREGSKSPLGMELRKCKVIYDIWEENYIVTISTTGKDKTRKLASEEDTVKLCATVKDLPFPLDAVKEGGEHRFAAAVDLNPVSKEVLEAMRSWLKRPLGDSSQLSPGDSFFGSFITIFINEKIEPSEKVVKLKSQKFKIVL